MPIASFDHLKGTYFEECAELLEAAYLHLAALEEGRADEDTVHAVFRSIHSIKGGGGAFGFARMVAFAHALETLLDLVRDGKVAPGPALIGLLIRSTDALSDLVAADRDGEAAPPGMESSLLVELEQAAGASPVAAHAPAAPVAAAAASGFRIVFAPTDEALRTGNEPLLLIRELKRLGTARVAVDLARLPSLAEMDAEAAYLAWTIELEGEASEADIAEVFDFVADHCTLTIEPLNVMEPAAEPAAAIAPAEPASAAEMPARAEEHEPSRRAGPSAVQSVRVDIEKVDRLVNLVGELVISQAMLVQLGTQLPPEMCPGLINGLETLSQHLRELQEGVMAIRTQPVRSVFSRMPRLVRELSAQLGKDVRLVISGEGTEIDKTVIEQLADPLTHLLRNALDHGIEAPDAREAAGKPRQGTIHLSAEHRGGRIVIELADDGGGIHREKVLARARQRGLVPDGVTPADEEIDELIFLPGFSTAETISNVSGRGVGMDVVRRNIQALGGRIALQSRFGEGSRFILSLPLTLAIMDGMVVAVGRESYIVPLTNIVESLRPRRQDLHRVAGGGDVVAIRGEYIPLIHLCRRFAVPGAVDDPARGIVVVVENESAGRLGLVVDELVGQQQIVVKSLERNYGAVQGVGGATILGNGRVALILDAAGLRDMPPGVSLSAASHAIAAPGTA
jgi:two-component system, chemotaxis family, sensor kinase CheA